MPVVPARINSHGGGEVVRLLCRMRYYFPSRVRDRMGSSPGYFGKNGVLGHTGQHARANTYENGRKNAAPPQPITYSSGAPPQTDLFVFSTPEHRVHSRSKSTCHRRPHFIQDSRESFPCSAKQSYPCSAKKSYPTPFRPTDHPFLPSCTKPRKNATKRLSANPPKETRVLCSKK